jgi:hypothetical protein
VKLRKKMEIPVRKRFVIALAAESHDWTLRLPTLVTLVFCGLTLAQAGDLPPLSALQHLKNTETFQQAKLTSAEFKQILKQVKSSAFDIPQSWEKELRVRPVLLQSVRGLIVQGTDLLCGGTGNCQTWVFRNYRGRWVSLFRDQAPLASGFGFTMRAQQGIPEFFVGASISADQATYTYFSYNGRAYSMSRCYRTKPDRQQAEKVSCG